MAIKQNKTKQVTYLQS